jgi:hypothetical protein
MHVYLPGCDTTTAIQAHRTHEPMSRAHQILLGTDNTTKLGADMSLFKRLTTYHRVPGQTDPKIFIHIDSRSARRQFGSHRLGALEDERGEVGTRRSSFPSPTKQYSLTTSTSDGAAPRH